jgi:hypothetical protein
MSQEPVLCRKASRLGLGVAMLLIAGVALGFWLIVDDLKDPNLNADSEPHFGRWDYIVSLVAVGVLGGLSIVGPPLLLLRRMRRPWGPGRILWFAQGTASWLLWPPVLYHRVVHGGRLGETTSGVCYFYGTPLMAIYMTSALLAGGHLRRGKRRLRDRSWEEKFGLILGMAWACTGLYFLVLFYRNDLFKR